MTFKFSDDQLMVLDNARIHKRLMHFGPQESYSTVEWPRRSASPVDISYLYNFMKNSMPPIGRKFAEEVKPICHVEQVSYEKRLGTTITIAYDGSRLKSKMAASISVFKKNEELFQFTQSVHGRPISSTRAEIYGVIMCIDYVRQQKLLG